MKLTIKTIKKASYEIEVPDNEQFSVSQLKQEIEKSQNVEASSLKLLCNGIVLDDSKSLKEYGIKNGSAVLMISSKAKPQNLPQEDTTTTKAPQSEASRPVNSPMAKPKVIPAQPDYSSQVIQLQEMGFDKESATKAITAAKGSINIAIDFLYNGLPNKYEEDYIPPDIAYDAEGNEPDEPEGQLQVDQDILNHLDLNNPNALSNIASIVKVLISEDPSTLQDILEDIEESNPEIIDFIHQNENAFKELIQQPVTSEDLKLYDQLNQGAGGSPGEGEEGDDDEDMGSHNHINLPQVQLTTDDKEAIERLKALGFQELEALEAYLACNKSEILAANFLLENRFKEGGDRNNP